ncbi:centromere protein S isoform 1-T1 [Spinachia spinachia]
MSVDKDETRQRLKAAVHYTAGRLCQKVGEEHRRPFSRQVVAAISETAFRQCGGFESPKRVVRGARSPVIMNLGGRLFGIRPASCDCIRVSREHAVKNIFAKDLEAFARHAKRSTVSPEDVKLVARRSTALSVYIQNKSEELIQEHRDLKKKNTGKRKSRDTEEESRE